MIQVLWSVPRKRHFQMTNDDGDSENYDRVQKHTKYMIIGFHLPLDIIQDADADADNFDADIVDADCNSAKN